MTATDDTMHANERRIDRMSVWISLAESTPAADDHAHVRFLFYWIAYEAGYKVENTEAHDLRPREGDQRREFHRLVARRDARGLQEILRRHRNSIDTVLGLRQAHPSFWERWREDDEVRTRADWETRFGNRVRAASGRLTAAVRSGISQDVAGTLDDLFRNLNVVRNQIVHGGSAGTHGRGRTQVLRGAELVKALVPRFRSTIAGHLDDDWGRPPFPRVGEKADDKCLPPWLSPPL